MVETKKFECPLCESILSENRYYEIIGVWEEKKKFEQDLKKQLIVAKGIKEKLLQEKVELKKQFEKQKTEFLKKAQEEAKKLAKKDMDKLKLELDAKNKKELIKAKKEALEQGKTHEKKRTDKLSKMLEGKMVKLQGANKRILESDKIIKELKEQLKKGTTPQVEGLNLEEELVKELKSQFPEDRIERHGHGGDIYHYVTYKKKEIGFIIYECKKTQTFKKDYVHQIKNDIAKQNASYGVLVTSASEKGKVGFWVKDGILIVHPYGTVYIAEVLRNWIIQLYAMKLSEVEMTECAKKLLEYIKGDKFKNCVEDTIDRTRQLNEMLKKEVTTHKNIWEKRHKHYERISKNSQNIEQDSKTILRNEKEAIKDIEEEAEKEVEEDPIIIFEKRRGRK